MSDFFSSGWSIFVAAATVLAGLAVVLLGALVGTLVGALAGYAGGWADEVLMRQCGVTVERGMHRLACVGAARAAGWDVVSAAEATGPAGWMIVRRCVSSKSNVCDVMPLSSAALPATAPAKEYQNE